MASKSVGLKKLVKTCLSAAATMAVTSSLVQAGPKIEFGEDAWLSIGAGLRTNITFREESAPNGDDDATEFNVENIRLYLNGQVTKNIGLTFNTERTGGILGRDTADADDVDVLDAIVRLEFSPTFNIWVGSLLTPADRIEMNGPFYGLSWNQFTVPLFASDQGGQAGEIGRDEGIVLWGSLDKFQYAFGFFDGLDGVSNQSDEVLFATRLAYNFLNEEQNPAYYTSSTYFGGLGNIFTVGFSFQSQSDGVGTAADAGDFSGFAIDVLSETVFGNDGVLTIEGEYKDFDSDFTGIDAGNTTDESFALFDGDSYFLTAAYLLPGQVGVGKLQPYFRFTENNPSDADSSDLFELGLNYIVSGHNARFNINYTSGDANLSGLPGNDVDAIVVGFQVQI